MLIFIFIVLSKSSNTFWKRNVLTSRVFGNVKRWQSILSLVESRGDYKFGLAAGYIGSFSYQLSWNDQCLQGEGGYCEYIDCRPLRWQEKNQNEKNLDKLRFYNHVYIKNEYFHI